MEEDEEEEGEEGSWCVVPPQNIVRWGSLNRVRLKHPRHEVG